MISPGSNSYESEWDSLEGFLLHYVMNPFKVGSSFATGFEDSDHKKQASNPVDSFQRGEIQNALLKPSKMF